MVASGPAAPLEDFPLGEDSALPGGPGLRPEPESAEPAAGSRGAAPAVARLSAAAADAALVLLLGALAVLAARAVTGLTPRPAGLVWTLAFLLYLSFFATVPPLVLFGKTVGMAISDLSARSEGAQAGLPAGAAFRRWGGTLATAATAGLLLLWTRRSPDLPTPADRLSGRPLSLD